MRSLVQIPLTELRALHYALAAGRVPWPLRAPSLQAEGLGHHATLLLAALGDLDRAGVIVLLDVVIAERTHQTAQRVHLVWTGPEAKRVSALDTAVVLRELFESARASVMIAGYSFDHGRELHHAMATTASPPARSSTLIAARTTPKTRRMRPKIRGEFFPLSLTLEKSPPRAFSSTLARPAPTSPASTPLSTPSASSLTACAR